jgi:hypothetical protein
MGAASWAEKKASGYDPDEPRDDDGKWTSGGGGGSAVSTNYNEAAKNAQRYYSEHLDRYDRIHEYTDNKKETYLQVNKALRSGREAAEKEFGKARSDELFSYADKLQKDLNEAPKFKGTVYKTYRGQTIANDVLASIKAGGLFTTRGFASTSVDRKTAESYMKKSPVASGQSHILLEFHQKSGVALSKVSAYKHENEVLVNHDKTFRVRSVSKHGGRVTISLEEP